MEDFEQQLRNALARKEQPPSFEAKVFAAIATRQSGRRILWRWMAPALAAVILIAALATSGSWVRHEREVQERAAGEAAKARLQIALKITVTQLSKIQQTVRSSTEDE
jgi:hypothetical protein